MEDAWLVETFFEHLRLEAFFDPRERREYEGVTRLLHDIPFYWTIWSDENRAGDALSFRQKDFLGFQTGLHRLDQHWLNEWAQATPSVLEVLLGMCRRWSYFYENPTHYYFRQMFLNMGFDKFPGKVLPEAARDRVRVMCDDWMSRQFKPNGQGSPFPIAPNVSLLDNSGNPIDMRTIDIWAQMNAYSLVYFQ